MRLFFEFQTSSYVQILTSAWNSHLSNLGVRLEIYGKAYLTKKFVFEITNNAYFRISAAVTPYAICKREGNSEISLWGILYTGRNIFELYILLFHFA
jgi:hypothetical protein